MARTDPVEQLRDAIAKSEQMVAVTGAGISVAAGGVTFAGGPFRTLMGSRGMFSKNPDKMYKAYRKSFLNSMFDHGPTLAHKELAKLETSGKLIGVITTNVDCLHTMAGSKNVAEIQGSFQVNVCTGCAARVYGYEIWNQGKMPVCEKCGSLLQPYSMYSKAGILPPELKKAQEWIGKADLILVIGAVGNYMHMYWECKRRDATVIQINPKKTAFDSETDLNIRKEADAVFAQLEK